MNTNPTTTASLRAALAAADSSLRLRAALAAGTAPDREYPRLLVERCRVEPDFFVRDMLTWALTRHDPSATVPLLLGEVRTGTGQARTQALHSLSKIADPRGWTVITHDLLCAADAGLATSAWRAAAVLVPDAEKPWLATVLASRLGAGEPAVQRSLSRALAALGPPAETAVEAVAAGPDPGAARHAIATRQLIADPDTGFEAAVADAGRILALGEQAC